MATNNSMVKQIMMTLEEEIETQYNNGTLVKDIMRNLNIHHGEFYRIVRKLKKENRLILRTRGQRKWGKQYRKTPKHYSWCHGSNHFQIRRNGVYYGCVKTQEQAERFVMLMEDCDWDYTRRKEIKQEVMCE